MYLCISSRNVCRTHNDLFHTNNNDGETSEHCNLYGKCSSDAWTRASAAERAEKSALIALTQTVAKLSAEIAALAEAVRNQRETLKDMLAFLTGSKSIQSAAMCAPMGAMSGKLFLVHINYIVYCST